jgi:GNAT superfamily N-acetyltransferase
LASGEAQGDRSASTARLPPGFAIRLPTPAERRACRMLLPAPLTGAEPCTVVVASVPAHVLGRRDDPPDAPRIVGAIAVAQPHARSPSRWPRVCVHVIPPLRRHGIATALMRTVVDHERRRGLGRLPDGRLGPVALAAWDDVDPQGDVARQWQSIGFTSEFEYEEHELSVQAVVDRFGPLLAEMTQAGWIPGDARIVPLAEADAAQREQLVQLYVEHLNGAAEQVRAELNDPRVSDPALSMVLLRGGRPVGFTLGAVREPGVCTVDANVLEPSHRLGWANLWLKLTAGEVLLSRGIPRTRFQTRDAYSDTRKVVRQVNGVTRRLARFYRFFPPT